MKHSGPIIQTYSGKVVNPLDLKVEDISILDIGHHLSNVNRFVGALRTPISVGQHSVHVSRLVEGTGWEKEALFHDATEAYLGDVTKWLKHDPCMAPYREAEDRAWKVICQALGLREELDSCVKRADELMVRFEAMKEMHKPQIMFENPKYPHPTVAEIKKVGPWYPLHWCDARELFYNYAENMGYKV